MRACLFQTSERGRLAALIRSAATCEEQRALLESHAPTELAIQAATAQEWDRCSCAACFGAILAFLESRIAPNKLRPVHLEPAKCQNIIQHSLTGVRPMLRCSAVSFTE